MEQNQDSGQRNQPVSAKQKFRQKRNGNQSQLQFLSKLDQDQIQSIQQLFRNSKPRSYQKPQILSKIEDVKGLFNYASKTPGEILSLEKEGDLATLDILKIVSQFKSKNKLLSVGYKFADKISMEQMNKHFDTLDLKDQQHLLEVILVDDIGTLVSSIGKYAGPMVTKYLWNQVKDTPWITKARKYMKEYLGLDLNDDRQGMYIPSFQADMSIQPRIDWVQDDNYKYSPNAVCTQAIASMFTPELTVCRQPSGNALKSGLVSRSLTFNVTVNSSGNGAFIIYPQRYDTSSNFAAVFNDVTFDPNTWAQTPGAVFNAGPLYGQSVIAMTKLNALVLTIDPIVSSFQNQGQIISVMNDQVGASIGTTGVPTTRANAANCQYYVQQSVPDVSHHRLTYDNTSVADESFTAYSTSRDNDFIAIILSGCQASSAILQVVVNYQVEYTINTAASTGLLIELQSPPLGPRTADVWNAALSQRPQLRLIGRQEAYSLYCELMQCEQDYESVLRLLMSFNFRHQDRTVNTEKTQDFSESLNY